MSRKYRYRVVVSMKNFGWWEQFTKLPLALAYIAYEQEVVNMSKTLYLLEWNSNRYAWELIEKEKYSQHNLLEE